jgi:hypothetical protein
MKSTLYFVILLSGTIIFNACDNSPQLAKDQASYIASVEKWQQDRLEGLKGKNGWLNLAGIYWNPFFKRYLGPPGS